MTDADLKLYGYWRSMAAYRVRVALNVKGISAREIAVDLDAGEQLSAEFLAVNPEGAVPALVVSGHPPLVQSNAILEFIEEQYPDPPLLPKDAYGRARVRSLVALVVSDTHPLIVPRVQRYLATKASFDSTALGKWQIHWIRHGLTTIEKRLASDDATGSFCHGDRVTLADICLASLATVVRMFKFDITDAPTVMRIVDRCETLDAFARAHPMRQLGAPKPVPEPS